jgi:carboxyl-terminal processing protease
MPHNGHLNFMSRRYASLALLLAAVSLPVILMLRADEPGRTPVAIASAAKTNEAKALAPSPDDGEIAYVTARALEQGHYRQHPFDNDYSEKFFDRYLESLDPQRLHFTQEDLKEFAQYRDKLDNLTLGKRRAADTTPAYRIFNRFRERLDQRVAYAVELLKNEKFVFDTDDQITVNRKDEPYPLDLDEARQLWRQRLRSEYLQEKIARYAAKQKAERDPKPKLSNAGNTNTLNAGEIAVRFGNTNKTPEQIAWEADKPSALALTNTKLTEVTAPTKKTDAEEIAEKLSKRYTRNAHFYHELDQPEVLEIYLTSLAHVYDPHTDYFNPRQAENFAIGMNLSLFGIGAVLQSDMEGYCKIAELKPGPAMNSKKIKSGDRIVAVAQSNAPPVDVVDMNLNKIVQMVRGPKGTEVRLTLVAADNSSDRWEVSLIREEIKLDDQAAKAKVIDLPSADGRTVRVGVIDLPSFYVPMDTGAGRKPDASDSDPHYTSKDVARLLAKLKKEDVKGVILDLRRNGGGSLEECVKLTGLFIKDGPVVQVNGPGGEPFKDEDDDPRIQYDGPLIVLTSRFSASASEILAGALQDYNRALIVGDLSTHGKGTVQQLNPLRMWIPESAMTNNPGTLKMTKAKFYRASGKSTQLNGVASDIVLPSKLNYAKDIGEASLDSALPYDTVKSAHFEKFNYVQPYLSNLLSQSSQRIATNQEFIYVREDIEQFRKYQALNSVSLNEKKRIQEWEEDDARQRARDKERLARKTPPPTVYELTLKQVDLPGLPAPAAKTNAEVAKVEGEVLGEDEGAEETPPIVDAALEETERIMLDYINLLAPNSLAAKTQ